MEPDFSISLDKICFFVTKARELDAKVAPEDIESGSNPVDDDNIDVLELRKDDPTYDEMVSLLDDLNDDEALDLIALMWIGRGTYETEDWEEARKTAAEEATHTTSDYLLGTPLLADYLEEGLNAFGLSCEGFEKGHL